MLWLPPVINGNEFTRHGFLIPLHEASRGHQSSIKSRPQFGKNPQCCQTQLFQEIRSVRKKAYWVPLKPRILLIQQPTMGHFFFTTADCCKWKIVLFAVHSKLIKTKVSRASASIQWPPSCLLHAITSRHDSLPFSALGKFPLTEEKERSRRPMAVSRRSTIASWKSHECQERGLNSLYWFVSLY